MKRFTAGLIVGKFSPLHEGHERLIHTALAACEKLLLLSYSRPEFNGYEAKKRQRWLQSRFPQAQIVVVTPQDALSWGMGEMPYNEDDGDIHRHFVASLCLSKLQFIPQAVFTAEDYGEGFAQVLSERFGSPVCHIRSERQYGPGAVSGTLLRSDIHGYRHLVAPPVYADFVHRVCLLGGESTGKSTLSVALAEALDTVHISEYGRERWEQVAGELDYEDMLHIAQTQIAREQSACPNHFLVCDTSPLTTLLYSQALFNRVDPQLEILAQRHYHTLVLCDADFSFVQDGTRQDESFRQMQQKWYEEELRKRNLPFLRVTGSVEQRVGQVIDSLLSISGQVLR